MICHQRQMGLLISIVSWWSLMIYHDLSWSQIIADHDLSWSLITKNYHMITRLIMVTWLLEVTWLGRYKMVLLLWIIGNISILVIQCYMLLTGAWFQNIATFPLDVYMKGLYFFSPSCRITFRWKSVTFPDNNWLCKRRPFWIMKNHYQIIKI